MRIHTYIHIYIYIRRERERESDREISASIRRPPEMSRPAAVGPELRLRMYLMRRNALPLQHNG